MKPRHPQFHTQPHLLDWEQWPRFDSSALEGADRALYDRREEAMRGLLLGEPRRSIALRVKLGRREIGRLMARCLEPHPDGRVFGFRALRPNAHVKPYVGSLENDAPQPLGSRGGHSGRMTALFAAHPELLKTLLTYFLGQNTLGGELVHESRVSYKAAHRRFISLCKEAGIRENQYPRNTDELGRTSLRKHLRMAYLTRWEESARARHGLEAARRLQSGIGSGKKPPVLRPFEEAVFDGHKIDACFEVEVPAPSGGVVVRVLDRLWLLAVRESASRAILAGDICLREEFGAADVEHCLANAVVPRAPMALTIPGLEYPKDGGLPGAVIPACTWAVWDRTAIDNAWANLAKQVRNRVIDAMGGTVDANAVGSPEARGAIERWFGILEENGFHRLPSTTGSSPRDVRRRNPEAQALRYRISLQDLRELTAVFVARENARPQEGIDFRSPLEFLRQYVNRGGLIRQLPEERRARFALLVRSLVCTVRGNAEDMGRAVRRPHVNIEGVPYHSDVLGKMPYLIGHDLRVEMNIDDLRTVRVFLENGEELGVLTAAGRWGLTPHNLTTRKAIMGLRRRGMLFFVENQCPIQTYMDHLAVKAQDHPAAVNELRRVREALHADTPWAASPPDASEADDNEDRGECVATNPVGATASLPAGDGASAGGFDMDEEEGQGNLSGDAPTGDDSGETAPAWLRGAEELSPFPIPEVGDFLAGVDLGAMIG